MSSSGISFFSTQKHKLKIGNLHLILMGNNVLLKTDRQLIVLKNVKDIILRNEHMYFCACGNVEISCDCSAIFKYFNLHIKLENINFEEFKQTALLDFVNNNFDVNKSKKVKKFINFVKNTLKININDKKIKILANNLHFSYQLVYRLNNKIKKINVSNSIGKF